MKYILLAIVCFALIGCNRASTQLEPIVCCPAHPKETIRENRRFLAIPADFSVSPFACLTEEELAQDWGKEFKIALAFAQDFDLYRAITNFKRALFLIPQDLEERSLEIQYDIVLAYYLGKKYTEALYDVESTPLCHAEPTFPAYGDLLLILYDCYNNLCLPEKAQFILTLIEKDCPERAERLNLLSAIQMADFETIASYNSRYNYLEGLFANYHAAEKSIHKAETLNALLPGAGYWYVGQRQTAVTAFIINAAFIAASCHFFDHGNIGAGIFTTSLECGWYFGGIYGAGLAAKLYNERLYETYSSNLVSRGKLFPLMMLRFTF